MTERPEVKFNDALCDDELIALRWKQRRRLRVLSDDFIDHVQQKFVAPEASARQNHETFEPRMAEQHLRQRAVELEKPLSDRLAAVENAVRVRSVKNMFDAWGKCCQLLADEYEAVSTMQDDATLQWLRTNTSEEIKRLEVLTAILLVADELAGDEYRDPRLGEPSRAAS